MNYEEAIEFLLELPDMERISHGSKARTMSLEAMRSMLQRLDNPHLGRKTVHITGSKGKGSTSAMIAAMLQSGSSTSLYGSPHLHSYRERMCLNLKPVSKEDFASGLSSISETVRAVHEGELGPASTFGAMTSLFFFLSRKHRVRWQVVEVGMGGRNDASNVFDSKELVVISAVSLEHTNVLGKTTLEIAENKAGIIRPGASVVLAPQNDPQVSQLIKRVCKEQGCRFLDVGSEYTLEAGKYDKSGQSFRFSVNATSSLSKLPCRELRIRMLGRHQLDNALTAMAAMDLLVERGEELAARDLEEAIGSVSVPGRMELIHESPSVLIDGAHNGESMQALVSGIRRHFGVNSAIFVLAVNSDKNIKQILEALKPFCSKLIATRSASQKAMDPALILAEAKNLGIECQLSEKSDFAIEQAIAAAGKDRFICATGSLYLVAEIREYFLGKNPPWSFVGSVEKVV